LPNTTKRGFGIEKSRVFTFDKRLVGIDVYKLPCKFDAVQPENKKTPEWAEIQALFMSLRCVLV
jgi:hypothetical protein